MPDTGGQLNVLVIDDEPEVRNLLIEVINRKEHQAIAVESAEEGLELLPHWTFQVAFLDQNLPGMEGLLLGEYLRRNNPDMMIALITGEPDRQLERRSRALRIRFLPKPFRVEEIFGLLDDYQNEAAEREERRKLRNDSDYTPPIADYIGEVTDSFGIPGVPNRIEARLADQVKQSLNQLRSVSRYSERDRVIALSGLLAARVLGVSLPRLTNGNTPFEEYDEIMGNHGRRTEFQTK